MLNVRISLLTILFAFGFLGIAVAEENSSESVLSAPSAQENSIPDQRIADPFDARRLLAQEPVVPKLEKEDRPSFFDGIRRIIGDSPAFDDNDATDGLVESLNRAEKAYDEIRQSNREAIRGMNRQIRIGQARQSPHIILVTLPQLRFDQLAGMPRLNGIRNSGVTFTNYYPASDVLKSSRWSLLTGQLATQAPADGKVIRKESLAEAMWQSGYETVMLGTWASGQHPLELGFDHWTGFPSSSGVVARYPEFFYSQTTQAKVLGNESSRQSSSLQLVTDEVTSFLERRQNASRQFYLQVGLPFLQGLEMNENISEVDRAIGQIVDAINSLELGGRVCLLVTGEKSHQIAADVESALPGVGQKLTYSKSGMHEGNMRSPLVVFWGNQTVHGSLSEVPCTTIDLLPTFQSLAMSQRQVSGVPGVSLVANLRGKHTPSVERLLYWRLSDGGQVARRGRWKVIVPAKTQAIELYDLEADPAEQHNVAAQHPDIVRGFIVKENPRQAAEEASL